MICACADVLDEGLKGCVNDVMLWSPSSYRDSEMRNSILAQVLDQSARGRCECWRFVIFSVGDQSRGSLGSVLCLIIMSYYAFFFVSCKDLCRKLFPTITQKIGVTICQIRLKSYWYTPQGAYFLCIRYFHGYHMRPSKGQQKTCNPPWEDIVLLYIVMIP